MAADKAGVPAPSVGGRLRQAARRGIRASAAVVLPERPERPEGVPSAKQEAIGREFLAYPSYRHRLFALRRVQRYTTREVGYREDVLVLMDKLRTYEFVRRHGATLPTLFGYWRSLSEVPWGSLPDRFVLKSTHGTGARGVFPLVRQPEGRFADLGSGRVLDDAELSAALIEGKLDRRPVFAEQLLGEHADRLPEDWKLYCFHGRVGMVMARDVNRSRNPKDFSFRYFDEDWNDLGKANVDVRIDPTLPRPRHPDQLLETARRLSAAVPRAHVRVDLYDTDAGVVFGELTPLPGGPHRLRIDVDRRLGELWERAEADLIAVAGRAGALGMGFVSQPEAVNRLFTGEHVAK